MPRTLRSTAYSGLASTATYDGALKEFYDGQMQSLVPTLFPIVGWLKGEGRVRKVKPQGKYIVFAVENAVTSGAGFRGENDYLPSADQADVVQGKVPYMKGIKGRIQLTWEDIKYGKEGVGSFADVMKHEFMSVQTSMKQKASVAMWACGDAVLAKLNGAISSSASFTVYSSETYAATWPGTRWMHEGEKVISCNLASSYAVDMAAALEIATITADTTGTFASTTSATTNYHLVGHHASDSSNATECTKGSVSLGTASSSRLPYGIMAMCDPGGSSGYYNGNGYGYGHALKDTYYGGYCDISESSYPKWKPNVSHNSGTARPLTLGLFYRMYNKICRKSGTFDPKVTVWMNPDMHIELTDLLEHYIEFKPRDLQPGYDKYDMMVNGVRIPIKLDFYCPGHIFFLSPADMTFAESHPISIAKESGATLRDVPDKDNYEAVWRWMWQLYTRNRNKHGIITDLSYTVSSV